MTAQRLRVAETKVVLANTAIIFSDAEPMVNDLGSTVRIDYAVTLQNRGRRLTVWDPVRQHLLLEDDREISGVEGVVRIAAHKSLETHLSFDVDEEQKPVALELTLRGKKVIVELAEVPETDAPE